jgi:hypothetical protein
MNLNYENFQPIDDLYDPAFLSDYERVHNEERAKFEKNMNELMLLHVYGVLDDYDDGNKIINPYTDRLVYDSSHGDIEIPIEIQKAAINQWKILKNGKLKSTNKNKIKKDSSNVVDSLFQFLLCILIIFTLMYTLSLFRRGVVRF